MNNYLIQGFSLVFQPGIRWLAFTPLAINLCIYLLLIFWLYAEFSSALDWAINQIPAWLGFIVPVAWILFGLLILILFGYSFALLAAVIASPFNGLLAEKVATRISGASFDEPLSIKTVSDLIKRSLLREITKLGYFLPRMIAVLLASFVLGFIPLLGLFASILVFLWAAWSMCIQYVDYPADNDGIDFRNTIDKLKTKGASSLVFGSLVTFLMGVPLLNLLTMPAAVAGATVFWHDQLSGQR